MKTHKAPAPPKHLSRESARTWRELCDVWVFDPTAYLLIQGGLECWDLYQRARAELAAASGVTTTSETGVTRQHPAAKVALDALSEARQCFRQLGLELPEPKRGY